MTENTLLRSRTGDHHGRVGFVELFFDLVFVFAVTQISHVLLAHPDLAHALQSAFLLVAMWVVWMWTTWATNWLDPDRAVVRLMIGCVMLGSMVLSSAIPHAFAGSAVQFALAYCSIQVGRCLFTAWAMERDQPGRGKNMLRASIWFAAADTPPEPGTVLKVLSAASYWCTDATCTTSRAVTKL